jgi:hypothetical protein
MSSFNNKTTDLHTSCTYYGKIETDWSEPSVIEFTPNYYRVVKAGDILEKIENAFQNANNNNKRVDSNDGTLLTKEEFLEKYEYGEEKWHDSISKDYKKKKVEEKRDSFYIHLELMLEQLHNFEKDDIIVPILTSCGYFPEDYIDEFNEICKSEQIDDNVDVDVYKWRCHPIFIDIYLDKIMNKIFDDDDNDDDDDDCKIYIEFLSFEAFEANAWTLLQHEGCERILIDKVTIKSFKEKKELFDVHQRIKNVVFDPEDGCNSQKIHCLKEILKEVEM